jgi:hypothetical protein
MCHTPQRLITVGCITTVRKDGGITVTSTLNVDGQTDVYWYVDDDVTFGTKLGSAVQREWNNSFNPLIELRKLNND